MPNSKGEDACGMRTKPQKSNMAVSEKFITNGSVTFEGAGQPRHRCILACSKTFADERCCAKRIVSGRFRSVGVFQF